jgi:hypothetical protein
VINRWGADGLSFLSSLHKKVACCALRCATKKSLATNNFIVTAIIVEWPSPSRLLCWHLAPHTTIIIIIV